MESGVYKIVNTINGKVYIGSSKNVYKRLRTHKKNLKNGNHNNCHLMKSVIKHGLNNFSFEPIEYCEIENLLVREQFWIDSYPKGQRFNLTEKAASTIGYRHSEENKKKMSLLKKGTKASPETRALLSKARKGNTSGFKKGQPTAYRPPIGNIPWNKGAKMLNVVWNKGTKGLMPEPWNKGTKGLVKPNSASFKGGNFKFISPDGQIYEGECVARFAKEMGLSKQCMYRVYSGIRKAHKGWKLAA